jgi:hypothetical protein
VCDYGGYVADRRRIRVQANLGLCHYGRDDAATMVGARRDSCGWVGVCERHRGQAEGDGYVMHELAFDDRGRDDTPLRRETATPTYDEPVEPGEPDEPSVGLDILDDPYPEPAGGRPLR